jgi:hypothetical protein
MSMHKADYLAALTRARDWLVAHPHVYAAIAAVVAFGVGFAV